MCTQPQLLATHDSANDWQMALGNWKPAHGFKQHEYGLQWYPSRAALLDSSPGSVLVATSYQHGSPAYSNSVKQARKYASLHTHEDFWQHISNHKAQDRPQNFHEVFDAGHPRCLYFDIDGTAEYRESHENVIAWLREFVRWFFCGDRLNWPAEAPEPQVLTSRDPAKYSCHVIFPQIQFRDFAEQESYIKVLLNALPALKVDLEGGVSLPVLQELVDPMPYMRFQLFRGPYACKLRHGRLAKDTQLAPEGYFRSDPLTYFAGYVNHDYALTLPSVEELLAWNEQVRELHAFRKDQVVMATRDGSWPVSPLDERNLYLPQFQRRTGGGVIDFAGMTDLELFEEALQWLHEERAAQWWSWFRISGVTCTMLKRYRHNRAACDRIWRAHMAWSRQYSHFDERENIDVVEAGVSKHVSGLRLLLQIIHHDNPQFEVRLETWQRNATPL
jgi:hypothetical protein